VMNPESSPLPSQVPACKDPADLKLSPAKEVFLLACQSDNEVIVYDSKSLSPIGSDRIETGPFGRGPVRIWFDRRSERKNRAYISYFLDGSIGVMDINLTNGQHVATMVDRIFTSGPAWREGGSDECK